MDETSDVIAELVGRLASAEVTREQLQAALVAALHGLADLCTTGANPSVDQILVAIDGALT